MKAAGRKRAIGEDYEADPNETPYVRRNPYEVSSMSMDPEFDADSDEVLENRTDALQEGALHFDDHFDIATNVSRLFDILPDDTTVTSLFERFNLPEEAEVDRMMRIIEQALTFTDRRRRRDRETEEPYQEMALFRDELLKDQEYADFVRKTLRLFTDYRQSGPMKCRAVKQHRVDNIRDEEQGEVESYKRIIAFYADPLHDFKADRMGTPDKTTFTKDQMKIVEAYIDKLANDQKDRANWDKSKYALFSKTEAITFNNFFNKIVDAGDEIKSNILLKLDVDSPNTIEKLQAWAGQFIGDIIGDTTQLIRDAAGTIILKRAGIQPSPTKVPFERAFDAAGPSTFSQNPIVDFAKYILRYPTIDNMDRNQVVQEFNTSGIEITPSITEILPSDAPLVTNTINITDLGSGRSLEKASVPNIAREIFSIIKDKVKFDGVFNKTLKIAGLTADDQRKIWTLLNLKRAGDQGQIEYAIQSSEPSRSVFFETSDYMAAVYGLITRANLVTKFKENTKSGNTYLLIRNFASPITIDDAKVIFNRIYDKYITEYVSGPMNIVLKQLKTEIQTQSDPVVILRWVKVIESFVNIGQFNKTFDARIQKFFAVISTFDPNARNMLKYSLAVKGFLDDSVSQSYGQNAMSDFTNVLVAFSSALSVIVNTEEPVFFEMKGFLRWVVAGTLKPAIRDKVIEFIAYIRSKKDILKSTLKIIAGLNTSASKLLENFDLYESYVDSLFDLITKMNELLESSMEGFST